MARVPGTPAQKNPYATRSLGLNMIIRFSNEQPDCSGTARMIERKQ